MQRLGILRAESGHEHINSSVVFPIFDPEGNALGMCGRKIACPRCGYTARTTRQWLDRGLPTCPCGTFMAEQS